MSDHYCKFVARVSEMWHTISLLHGDYWQKPEDREWYNDLFLQMRNHIAECKLTLDIELLETYHDKLKTIVHSHHLGCGARWPLKPY